MSWKYKLHPTSFFQTITKVALVSDATYQKPSVSRNRFDKPPCGFSVTTILVVSEWMVDSVKQLQSIVRMTSLNNAAELPAGVITHYSTMKSREHTDQGDLVCVEM